MPLSQLEKNLRQKVTDQASQNKEWDECQSRILEIMARYDMTYHRILLDGWFIEIFVYEDGDRCGKAHKYIELSEQATLEDVPTRVVKGPRSLMWMKRILS